MLYYTVVRLKHTISMHLHVVVNSQVDMRRKRRSGSINNAATTTIDRTSRKSACLMLIQSDTPLFLSTSGWRDATQWTNLMVLLLLLSNLDTLTGLYKSYSMLRLDAEVGQLWRSTLGLSSPRWVNRPRSTVRSPTNCSCPVGTISLGGRTNLRLPLSRNSTRYEKVILALPLAQSADVPDIESECNRDRTVSYSL